jgi:hypothetical protein
VDDLDGQGRPLTLLLAQGRQTAALKQDLSRRGRHDVGHDFDPDNVLLRNALTLL